MRQYLKEVFLAAAGGLLYIILHFFGLGIVNMCIMQSDVNRAYPV